MNQSKINIVKKQHCERLQQDWPPFLQMEAKQFNVTSVHHTKNCRNLSDNCNALIGVLLFFFLRLPHRSVCQLAVRKFPSHEFLHTIVTGGLAGHTSKTPDVPALVVNMPGFPAPADVNFWRQLLGLPCCLPVPPEPRGYRATAQHPGKQAQQRHQKCKEKQLVAALGDCRHGHVLTLGRAAKICRSIMFNFSEWEATLSWPKNCEDWKPTVSMASIIKICQSTITFPIKDYRKIQTLKDSSVLTVELQLVARGWLAKDESCPHNKLSEKTSNA